MSSSFFDAMNVVSSGLEVQKERMGTISSNIANIHSYDPVTNKPYKRRDVVVEAIPQHEGFRDLLNKRLTPGMTRAQVVEVREDNSPPKLEYNPTHPRANAQGYVEMPNINYIHEMANLMEATRSYEANIAVMNALKQNNNKAMEIGR
mgnify:FL=1